MTVTAGATPDSKPVITNFRWPWPIGMLWWPIILLNTDFGAGMSLITGKSNFVLIPFGVEITDGFCKINKYFRKIRVVNLNFEIFYLLSYSKLV